VLRRRRIHAFYGDHLRNVRYLTGFTGSSAFVLVTHDRALFVTDFRYQEQAALEVHGWDIVIQRGRKIDALRRLVRSLAIGSLGFESSLSFEWYELLGSLGVKRVALKGVVERMRRVKDERELVAIKEAVRRAEEAFLAVKPMIRVGTKEREVALRLEARLKRNGCRAVPFDIIVASGRHSSMPHAKPTEKKIEPGDLVTIDWGGEADGYHADMTRTLLISGRDLSKKIEIYRVVNEARQRAIDAVCPGAKARGIDAVARSAIGDAGYADCFGHGTGHGVGVEVHEAPYISRTSNDVVDEGMVFTVEPGIYIPDLGGVRIEDMVAVRRGRATALTSLSRELEIIR
jgi:Xaa-Pro aminopeptidase